MGPILLRCCAIVHEVDGIERIRFLTSHPNYFSEDLYGCGGGTAQGDAAHRSSDPGWR